MAHFRNRLMLDRILQKLKLWPIVAVVGARQSGKSHLLSKYVCPSIKGKYHSLDSPTLKSQALKSPESFSKIDESLIGPLIIDEIQKVPALFDAIKLHVDNQRRPGRYIISGSTEFSKYSGVKEALTGRIAILHLYPLSLSELYQKSMGTYIGSKNQLKSCISLDQFDRKIERGGMPGLCFLPSDNEFHESWNLWLEMTCYRDLDQVLIGKTDGSLARDIIGEVAVQHEATAASIGRALRKDARVITRYLEGLTRIFVVNKLTASRSGVGKDIYVLFDSGLVTSLEGSRENALKSHVISEGLVYAEALGFGKPRLEYYRNAKTSRVPIIFSWPRSKSSPRNLAIKIFDGETPTKRDFDSLLALKERVTEPMRFMMLTQATASYLDYDIEVHPLRG